MSYRENSGWDDINELLCLLIFTRLQKEGFPRGMQTELCKEAANATSLSKDTLMAKVGNYKSTANVNKPSNASSDTERIYNKYGKLVKKLLSR